MFGWYAPLNIGINVEYLKGYKITKINVKSNAITENPKWNAPPHFFDPTTTYLLLMRCDVLEIKLSEQKKWNWNDEP